MKTFDSFLGTSVFGGDQKVCSVFWGATRRMLSFLWLTNQRSQTSAFLFTIFLTKWACPRSLFQWPLRSFDLFLLTFVQAFSLCRCWMSSCIRKSLSLFTASNQNISFFAAFTLKSETAKFKTFRRQKKFSQNNYQKMQKCNKSKFTDSYHHHFHHHHHLHHPYQHYERTATSLQLLANVTIVELSRACNTLYGGSFALAIACSSNKMNIILVCSLADYQRYFKFFFQGGVWGILCPSML